MKTIYYFDNASTTWPKPERVYTFMDEFFREFGVNPGRGGYEKASVVGELVDETRELLCQFFNAPKPERLVFTQNATDSLNIAFNGLFKAGEHVLTTMLEHNAVLRPVNYAVRDKGLEADFVPANADGYIESDALKKALKPNTKYLVINHASNVIGTIQDLTTLGNFAKEHNLIFIVDTCQTAGVVPVDVEKMHIDILTFTGHKGLFGPMGIGGMWVRENIDIQPVKSGGTGILSAYEYQPDEYPYRLETGTVNLPGIAGLKAAQDFFAELGRKDDPNLSHKQATDKALEIIHKQEMSLMKKMLDALTQMPKVKFPIKPSLKNRVATISFQIEGKKSKDVGATLAKEYKIATRSGLHCAPKVHQQLGTAPDGATRVSIGYFTTEEDIDHLIEAVSKIAES